MAYANFHRKMEEYTFKCFVSEHKSWKETLRGFSIFKNQFKDKINLSFFTNDYCKEYMFKYYYNLRKNKKERMFGFSKEKTFRDTIIKAFANRYRRSYVLSTFLSQEKLSKVWGVSQQTISRWIKKLIDEDIIKTNGYYSYKEKMAKVYFLCQKGLELLSKITRVFDHAAEKAKEKVEVVINLIKGRYHEVNYYAFQEYAKKFPPEERANLILQRGYDYAASVGPQRG